VPTDEARAFAGTCIFWQRKHSLATDLIVLSCQLLWSLSWLVGPWHLGPGSGVEGLIGTILEESPLYILWS
jgi:hypothetical protein